MAKLIRCHKHPHYKGKGPVPAECETCLKTHEQLAVPRQFVRPTKVIPSKKTYNRKAKHRSRGTGLESSSRQSIAV